MGDPSTICGHESFVDNNIWTWWKCVDNKIWKWLTFFLFANQSYLGQFAHTSSRSLLMSGKRQVIMLRLWYLQEKLLRLSPERLPNLEWTSLHHILITS